MTELDQEIPQLATDLINEYGKVIKYVHIKPGDYDTNTSKSSPQETPVDIKAVIEPYRRGFIAEPGLVEIGDLKMTCARESFDQFDEPPSPLDKCYIDGAPFHIIAVAPTYSGELIAIYEFLIRAG